MRLPKPIYEALPYIYIVSAILSVILVGSILSFFSGFFFGYAGWMVWRTRKDYRQFNVVRSDLTQEQPAESGEEKSA